MPGDSRAAHHDAAAGAAATGSSGDPGAVVEPPPWDASRRDLSDPRRKSSWPAACRCGWDAHGDLRVVDVYDEAWPPGPRGNANGWIRATTGDGPDDPRECAGCGADLDPWSGLLPRAGGYTKAQEDELARLEGRAEEVPGVVSIDHRLDGEDMVLTVVTRRGRQYRTGEARVSPEGVVEWGEE